MITRLTPTTANNFYMSPRAINWTLNALGDKDTLEVSVYANAKIAAFSRGVIGYNPDNNYRQWTIAAFNTYFEDTVARYVHIAISKVGDVATVVYPTVRLDIFGRPISDFGNAFIDDDGVEYYEQDRYGASNEEEETEEDDYRRGRASEDDDDFIYVDENGNVFTPEEEDPDYFYLFIGKLSSSVQGYREWEIMPLYGNLDTDQYRNEEGVSDWQKMFRLNPLTDMIEQLRPLTALILGKAKKIARDIWTSMDEGEPENPDETLLTYGGFESAAGGKFIRKDIDDEANGHIKFNKGLTADEQFSSFLIPSSGAFDGQGWHMWMDPNKMSHLQVDFLNVVKKAIFAELEIRKYTSIGGNLILSGASSTLQEVVPIYDDDENIIAWKCYLKTDDGTTATMNDWQEGMQAICQSFNVREGVYQNVENQYYWRVVSGVHQRGGDGDEAYIILSNEKGYYGTGSSEPKKGDAVVQCGFNQLYYVKEINPFDSDLRLFPYNLTGVLMLESNALSSGAVQIATSIKSYDLVTDFSFAKATQTARIARDGVSFNAASFRWSSGIGEISPLVYVGDWNDWDWEESPRIPYFHEVDYGGFRWTCIAQAGAPHDEPPSENSIYWKLNKTKGITYDAYLEHDSDNITVDADGNVVDGLWEESISGGITSKVFKLHTAVFAQKNEDFLTLDYISYGIWSRINFDYIDGLPYRSLVVDANGIWWRWNKAVDATKDNVPGEDDGWEMYNFEKPGAGHYCIEIAPNECTAIVKEGMIHIVAINHIKDGVNNSGDDEWDDDDYEAMRAMQRCYVDVAINMEGVQTKLLNYTININHIPTSTITASIDNQAGTLSWCESSKSYVNTCGGVISAFYRNMPVDIYYQNGSEYNPYVEIFDKSGNEIFPKNGDKSVIKGEILQETSMDGNKVLRLVIEPRQSEMNAIRNGIYTAHVHFVVRVNGIYYEKLMTHDMRKDEQGVSFELQPSNILIHAKYNDSGDLVPEIESMTCGVVIVDYSGNREATEEDWETYKLTMSCNGKEIAYGEDVAVSSATEKYVFELKQNGFRVDKQESILVSDGKVGEDGNDIEYIYARTLNKTSKPNAPRFNAPYDTKKITDTAQDTNNSLTWTNHPQGTTTALACEWMSQRFSYTDDKTGERKWKNDFSAPVEWHIDGDGLEYIYCYTKTSTSPKTALANNATQDMFVPATSAAAGESGWLDEPNSSKTGWTARSGVDAEYPYLWQSTRKKTPGGNWGNFSTPILRDHYGLDALSLQLDKTNVGVQCNSDGKPRSGTAIVVTASLKYGNDVPSSMSVSGSGWTKDGWTAKYTYTPNTSAVMSASSQTVTVTVTKKDGSTETLTGVVYFTPVVNGKGVNKIDNYYQLGLSPTVPPTGTWQKNTMLDPTTELPYLWNYEMIYGDDGSLIVDGSGDKHVISVYGKSISDIKDYYCVRQKGVTPGINDKDWVTDSDSLTLPEGTHLMWNYEKIDYTDGTSYIVSPHPVGVNIKGDDGRGEINRVAYYAIHNSATSAPSFSDKNTSSPATTDAKPYLWRQLTITYNKADASGNTTKVLTEVVGVHGTKGTDGDADDYIYCLCKTKGATLPAYPTAPLTSNSGTKGQWQDDALGVDSEWQYEYVAVAHKRNGTWGAYGEKSIYHYYVKDGEPGGPGSPGADAVILEVESGSLQGLRPSQSKKSDDDNWFTLDAPASLVIKAMSGSSRVNITSIKSATMHYRTVDRDVINYTYCKCTLSSGKITVTISAVPQGSNYKTSDGNKETTWYIPITTASITLEAVANDASLSIVIPITTDFTANFASFYKSDELFEQKYAEFTGKYTSATQITQDAKKLALEAFYNDTKTAGMTIDAKEGSIDMEAYKFSISYLGQGDYDKQNLKLLYTSGPNLYLGGFKIDNNTGLAYSWQDQDDWNWRTEGNLNKRGWYHQEDIRCANGMAVRTKTTIGYGNASGLSIQRHYDKGYDFGVDRSPLHIDIYDYNVRNNIAPAISITTTGDTAIEASTGNYKGLRLPVIGNLDTLKNLSQYAGSFIGLFDVEAGTTITLPSKSTAGTTAHIYCTHSFKCSCCRNGSKATHTFNGGATFVYNGTDWFCTGQT